MKDESVIHKRGGEDMYRVHVLYYINGRLASNQDLRDLFKFEREHNIYALRQISYPRLNVKVVKYTTNW
jgi:hypothetical protein